MKNRDLKQVIQGRLAEKNALIQVLLGPRQDRRVSILIFQLLFFYFNFEILKQVRGMGNSIDHNAIQKSLGLSNGGTEVLLIALLLSGCSLAKTPWEITLMQWLAEHDQNHLGLGVVGFDLSEIAWDEKNFDAQKDFLFCAVQKAYEQKPWLDFDFELPFVVEDLKNLEALVLNFERQHIQKNASWSWAAVKPKVDLKCKTHAIYLHALSRDENEYCLICNVYA